MQPRLAHSKKWTEFPKELAEQILEVVKKNFQPMAPSAQFFVEGRIYPQEILFKLGYLPEGQITQTNIWVSAEYDGKKENVKDRFDLVIDCAGSLLSHHFEHPDEEFPRVWQEFLFNKSQVFICMDRSNDDLEAQADALLGVSSEKALVQESEAPQTEDSSKGKKDKNFH